MNSTTAENFMRSATAPTISAGVMAGEGHLEADVDVLGDDHAVGEGLDVDSGVTPARKALEKPPTKALKPPPSVKAML